MRLKTLEIEGFKSFADKTLLKFDQSITGVVGPNGCGKSNIVDAMRWVLGEQSVKNLRGRQMEDVIFAGAKDREMGSMSSVEMTFDIEGTLAVPQYANCREISVGRKLYRSGESEYYINRQVVRLKDVVDLFLGTGIGTKAYSIIEQGRVGQIVTAKPEERRKVIEEAAGISKFQARKEAATRKMEATRQNLLRLTDIVSELERQKGTLERQAKKAEKYKAVRDELEVLDLSVAAFDYQAFDTRQAELLADLRATDDNYHGVAARVQELENQFETGRLEQSERDHEFGEAQQKSFECDNEYKLSESRLASRREERERLTRDSVVESDRLTTAQTELAAVEEQLAQAGQDLVAADLDCSSWQEAVANRETDLSAAREWAEQLFMTVDSARKAGEAATKRSYEIAAQRETWDARLADAVERKDRAQTELTDITGRHDKLAKLVRESHNGLSSVKQLKLELGERTQSLSADVEHAEQTLAQERAESEQVKEELLRKKSRLHSLEELERNFEGYQSGPRTVLERKRSGQLDFVQGTVPDFIETDAQFEGAVSAVLGDRMQCVVVQSYAEGVECASYLKEVSGGRGSFIPMQATEWPTVTKTIVSSAPQDVPGLRGFLSDHVRVRDGYENLKQVLFGSFLLVDDLGQALEAWQRLQAPVVTLAGEVISAKGVLSGGSAEQTSQALLEKKREIKELQVAVSELVDRAAAKAEACMDLERKLKMLKADLEGMKAAGREEDVKMALFEKELVHSQRELDSLQARQQELSKQILFADEAIATAQPKLAELADEEPRVQAAAQEAREQILAGEADEAQARRELANKQNDLVQDRVSFAQADERRTALRKDNERLAQDKVRLRQAVIRSEEHLTELQKAIAFCEERIAFEEKNLDRLLEAKNLAEAELIERKNICETLSHQLLEIETELKDVRRSAESMKDHLNATTLALSECRNVMSRLAEVTLERYQLILSEVWRDRMPQTEGFDRNASFEQSEELRRRLASMGSVNIEAISELEEVATRFDFLSKQKTDLEESLASLEQAIQKINHTTKQRFRDTFELVNEKFSQLFPKLFQGGEASLRLTDPENILETGVDIVAQPPGKKLQSISLLSGGEKALTAVSLLFAIFLIKPSPFCLLDEVDAPLDDANVDRYNDIVKEMSARTQFVVITHNKRTMQVTDSLYGVTMEKSGVSKLVSVNLN